MREGVVAVALGVTQWVIGMVTRVESGRARVVFSWVYGRGLSSADQDFRRKQATGVIETTLVRDEIANHLFWLFAQGDRRETYLQSLLVAVYLDPTVTPQELTSSATAGGGWLLE